MQEPGAVFATSTLSSNPWHDTAAGTIPHSESTVSFLLKTKRIADSHVHVQCWARSCIRGTSIPARGTELERASTRRNTMVDVFGATSTTEEVLAGVNLHSKRILVTGVSAGIGVETARSLAAHGAQVVGA